MHIWIHLHDPLEREHLLNRLQTWMELSCISIDVVAEGAADPLSDPSIIFWDLDGSDQPPPLCQGPNHALFLCSRDPQRAIDSYSFHPTGFLTKPVSMNKLWSAMLRCTHLWFPSLMRLEVLSDRVKIGVPYRNLIWVEGTRRGCLLHTSHQNIIAREPLYCVEQRLPEAVFIRCQRSFLVNLNHVKTVAGTSLFLKDGTELSLSRGTKAAISAAFHHFCQLRYSE